MGISIKTKAVAAVEVKPKKPSPIPKKTNYGMHLPAGSKSVVTAYTVTALPAGGVTTNPGVTSPVSYGYAEPSGQLTDKALEDTLHGNPSEIAKALFEQAIATVSVSKDKAIQGGGKQVIAEGSTTEVIAKALSGTCKVRASAGRTINMGNFESTRIDVSLEMPCDTADINATYEFITDWLSAKVAEVESGLKG